MLFPRIFKQLHLNKRSAKYIYLYSHRKKLARASFRFKIALISEGGFTIAFDETDIRTHPYATSQH